MECRALVNNKDTTMSLYSLKMYLIYFTRKSEYIISGRPEAVYLNMYLTFYQHAPHRKVEIKLKLSVVVK